MLSVGLIGHGAIARYVAAALPDLNARLGPVITRAGREDAARAALGTDIATAQTLAEARPDVMVDCAGHEGLRDHGSTILRAGVPLITVSLGALADTTLHGALSDAARHGNTRLHLCTGAIGGLDALAAAKFGRLDQVTYTGRKPPQGWKGSRAEQVMDLDAPGPDAVTHFTGSARDAALQYPKNANVAAAVALAGLGFDATQVALIADPNVTANIHHIHATGDFGEMQFTISGLTLPGNPRTSALAAMSVLRALSDLSAPIRI